MNQSTATVMLVDPNFPVDYSKVEVPPTYKCGNCGVTGCKLWRDYQTFLEHQTLLCAKCAGKNQGKDVSGINAEGKVGVEPLPEQLTDQIGWYVPAVPTVENDTFWGYSSVPGPGVRWWKNLPTLIDQ